MENRLRKYLEAREHGGWGWQDRYEKDVLPGGENWPWLAGHYCGMLDDVLGTIGERRFAALLDACDVIDEQLKKPAPRDG